MDGDFAILNPCPKKWSDLSGNGRARYCDVCKKHVHVLDEYSPEERGALWRESSGHVCGMLAAASPQPVRSRRVILLGALLTAVSPLFAQSGRVRIRVVDPTGMPVKHALVSLWGRNENIIRQEEVDENGEVVLRDLPLGDSTFSVVAGGFDRAQITITVRDAEEQTVTVTLQIGALVGELVEVRTAGPAASGYIPSPTLLDLPPPQQPIEQTLPITPAAPPPQPKPAKHHWWQVFR